MTEKLHFRIDDGALCGVQLLNPNYDSTQDEARVDCKNCLRKLPKWRNEQNKIIEYNAAHNIEIIITLPLAEWRMLESDVLKTMRIYGLLGGVSKFQLDFWKRIMDAPKTIKRKTIDNPPG